MIHKRPLILLSTLLLSSCAVGPDYTAPKDTFLSQWFAPKTQHVNQESVNLAWWKVFDDPLLERYIESAALHNKDLEIALANLRRARALHRIEKARFFPQIGSAAEANRSKSSESISSTSNADPRNLYDAGIDAAWAIDIFGGTRRANEAAAARVDSTLADYHGVMLSTLSEVARNYYEARGLQKRIAIIRNNANLQQQTYELVQARLKAGEASAFDVSRARGEYQITGARIPNLQAELNASVYALSVLLGQPPEALLDEMQQVKALPTPPDLVPVGLRADILRRRPDIRGAERILAAETADIGVATAELFPKLSLTGDIGTQARLFGDVFSAAAGMWSLGSMVQWSIFEGGALRAQIDAAEEESKAALAAYQQTVLKALSEAETALIRYGQELETRKMLADGVASRRESVALAKKLFDAGETDYLAVLDSERELTASEDNLILSETNSITKLITLYTTLGGGWEDFAARKDDL